MFVNRPRSGATPQTKLEPPGENPADPIRGGRQPGAEAGLPVELPSRMGVGPGGSHPTDRSYNALLLAYPQPVRMSSAKPRGHRAASRVSRTKRPRGPEPASHPNRTRQKGGSCVISARSPSAVTGLGALRGSGGSVPYDGNRA